MTQAGWILGRLAEMVAEASDVITSPADVGPDMHLIDDLGLSSMMIVNLVVDLEGVFDIELVEGDFENLLRIADVAALIERKRGAK